MLTFFILLLAIASFSFVLYMRRDLRKGEKEWQQRYAAALKYMEERKKNKES